MYYTKVILHKNKLKSHISHAPTLSRICSFINTVQKLNTHPLSALAHHPPFPLYFLTSP